MDISKKYIKMSDCPELQDDKKWENGDFYACTLSSGNIMVFVWTDTEDMPTEIYKPIKLYRQDQLQEMVKEMDLMYLLNKFYEYLSEWFYVRSDFWWKKWTMEQLWLAFVMNVKYQKIWDDEKEEWITKE